MFSADIIESSNVQLIRDSNIQLPHKQVEIQSIELGNMATQVPRRSRDPHSFTSLEEASVDL